MTTVLITGANRGVGLALARQYAANGAQVISCCREPANADVLKQIASCSSGRVRITPLELADEASIKAVKRSLGNEPIDILLHNAGINGGSKPQTPYEIDGENWINCMRVNALGPMLLSQALFTNLKAGKDKKLVAISSAYGSISREWTKAVNAQERYAYRASKAALNSGMRALSRDWAEHGVVVGILDPGWVKTDMGLSAGENPGMISPEDSAVGLIKRIGQLTPELSGQFTRFGGETLPW
ncbi:SDR family oxidoreductase [Bradyrhizobium brasilense]|uniref:SDR family oxidoreductase n=1 Tax=Bradyrhizobium brasilense TaxID=1419277 RepID=UPI0028773D45|nr:SDR family oxidoreductase [Bradyrhizobium brasilense]MCP3419600.1 SDR family oxidoreductase [Bradyrhizobium brasilense]